MFAKQNMILLWPKIASFNILTFKSYDGRQNHVAQKTVSIEPRCLHEGKFSSFYLTSLNNFKLKQEVKKFTWHIFENFPSYRSTYYGVSSSLWVLKLMGWTVIQKSGTEHFSFLNISHISVFFSKHNLYGVKEDSFIHFLENICGTIFMWRQNSACSPYSQPSKFACSCC